MLLLLKTGEVSCLLMFIDQRTERNTLPGNPVCISDAKYRSFFRAISILLHIWWNKTASPFVVNPLQNIFTCIAVDKNAKEIFFQLN